MTRVNSVAQPFDMKLLPQPVFGYAANKAQRESLIASGIPARAIWTQGDGTETLEWALAKFRGLKGTLVISSMGRVLGDTKASALAAARKIELAGVAVYDLAVAALSPLSDVISRALTAVLGSARIKNRRHARYIGGKGGNAKGASSDAHRTAIMSAEAVKRLCAHPALTWRDCAEILGSPFSIATLQRHYR